MFKKNLKWLIVLAAILIIWSTVKPMEKSSTNNQVLSIKSPEQISSNTTLLPYKEDIELSLNLQKEGNFQNKTLPLTAMLQHRAIESRPLPSVHQQSYIPPEKRKEGHLGVPPTPEMVFASPDGKL